MSEKLSNSEAVYVELGQLLLQTLAIVMQRAAKDPKTYQAIVDSLGVKLCDNDNCPDDKCKHNNKTG